MAIADVLPPVTELDKPGWGRGFPKAGDPVLRRRRTMIQMIVVVATLALSNGCGDSVVVPPPEPPRATTITVNPATAELSALGATVQLTAEVRDQNHQVMAGVAVAWSSSDSSVAIVGGAGLVAAVGNGEAVIAAAVGSVAGTAAVVVEQEAVALLGLPAADTLLWYGDPGDTLRLSAEPVDANRHRVEGLPIEWSSSLTSVATVDAGGLVRGAGEGVTTVTAVTDGLRASTELAVVNRDRAALIAIYHATGGPNWERTGHWLTSLSMRDWEGVATHLREDGVVTVTGLRLAGNNLTGTIPPEIGNLTGLEWLWLQSNQLTGPIPLEIGNLTGLASLSLSSNSLTGPIPLEVGKLTGLKQLWLYNNALTGPIPPEIGNLTGLDQLVLGGNQLTGPIPPEIGNLTGLVWLLLSGNPLASPIPPEIGNLTGLKALWLSNNQLVGPIPLEIGNLAGLEYLSLYDNHLAGPIPPWIGDLTRLKGLWLYNNALTGALPQTLTRIPLTHFHWYATQLCAPPNEAFQQWLRGIVNHHGGLLCQ